MGGEAGRGQPAARASPSRPTALCGSAATILSVALLDGAQTRTWSVHAACGMSNRLHTGYSASPSGVPIAWNSDTAWCGVYTHCTYSCMYSSHLWYGRSVGV